MNINVRTVCVWKDFFPSLELLTYDIVGNFQGFAIFKTLQKQFSQMPNGAYMNVFAHKIFKVGGQSSKKNEKFNTSNI